MNFTQIDNAKNMSLISSTTYCVHICKKKSKSHEKLFQNFMILYLKLYFK